MKRILIAVPTGGKFEDDCIESIYNMKVPDGYETKMKIFYGHRIDDVRNKMSQYSVENKYDYTFFADSDMVFPEDTLVKLLDIDAYIASGIYVKRNDPSLAVVYIDNPEEPGKIRNLLCSDELTTPTISVLGIGFGGVLIKNEVLEDITYPQFYFELREDGQGLSEDLFFSFKARSFGYEVHVVTDLLYGHIGNNIKNYIKKD